MIEILLLILGILILLYAGCNENFNLTTGKYCINCEKKTFGQCMDCFNCGFCLTGKDMGYCTSGTRLGPDVRDKTCKRWIHNDEFSRDINLKKKIY